MPSDMGWNGREQHLGTDTWKRRTFQGQSASRIPNVYPRLFNDDDRSVILQVSPKL